MLTDYSGAGNDDDQHDHASDCGQIHLHHPLVKAASIYNIGASGGSKYGVTQQEWDLTSIGFVERQEYASLV